MKILTSLFVLLLISGSILAQSSKKLGLNLGLTNGLLKDSNLSSFNYQDNGFNLQLFYQKWKAEQSFSEIILNVNKTDLKTDFTEYFTALNLHGGLSYSYLRHISKNNKALDLFLGGEFRSNAIFIDYRGLDSFTFLFSHGIRPRILALKQVGKGTLSTSLSIAILQLQVRPPYNGFDKDIIANAEKPLRLITDGRITSISTYQNLEFKTDFEYPIRPKLGIAATYQYVYLRHNDIHKLVQSSHQLSLGFRYNY